MATTIKAAPDKVESKPSPVKEALSAPEEVKADVKAVRLAKGRSIFVSIPLNKTFEANTTYTLPENESSFLLGMRDEFDKAYFVEWSAANSALERKSQAIKSLAENDGFARLAQALLQSLSEEQIENLMVAVQENSGEEVDL